MPETVLVNGNAYSLLKLLGKGKGGYSYLAQMADGQQVVVKQIHKRLDDAGDGRSGVLP